MAERHGWSERKPSYRSRLIGAGASGKLTGQPMSAAETRIYWESGGDLRGGRSHRPRAIGAAPRTATEKESVGLGDQDTWQELERWRKKPPSRGGPPEWLRSKKAWQRPRSSAPIDVTVTGYRKSSSTGNELPMATPGDRMDETTVSTDTAAILSQIDIPPNRWKAVELRYLDNHSVMLIVTPKGNAYPRYAIFPDYQSAQEVGRLLNLSKRVR